MDHQPSARALSRRTHCSVCGARKEKRWGEGRSTLVKFCPNEKCELFGVPQMVSVKTIVTFDKLGRRRVSHKEVAIRRQPTFTEPLRGTLDGPADMAEGA